MVEFYRVFIIYDDAKIYLNRKYEKYKTLTAV